MKFSASILLTLLAATAAARRCNSNKGICRGGVCVDVSGAGNTNDPKCAGTRRREVEEVGAHEVRSVFEAQWKARRDLAGEDHDEGDHVVLATRAIRCNRNKGLCNDGVCSDVSGAGDTNDPKCIGSPSLIIGARAVEVDPLEVRAVVDQNVHESQLVTRAIRCNRGKGLCQNGVCSDVSGAGDTKDPKCVGSGSLIIGA